MAPTRPLNWFAVAALVALSACSGDDGATPSTTTTPVTTTTLAVVPPTLPPDLTASYVLALTDPAAEAADVAISGSDAARYLELRRTTARILGLDLSMQPGGIEHRLCDGDGCAVLGDFVADSGGGLVDSLSVDGESISGRISGIGTLADADGVVGRVRVAYRTNAGQVTLVLVITNTTEADVELFGFAAVYQQTSGGGGVEAAGSWGEAQIAAGASGTMVLVFDAAQLGGRIGLRGLRADGHDLDLDIAVPAA